MLDPRTLVVALVVVATSLGVVMAVMWVTRKTYPGFGLWTIASTVYAGGFLLLAARGWLPGTASIVACNLLFIVSSVLIHRGVRRFLGVREDDMIGPALVVAVIAASSYWHGTDADIWRRAAFVSGAMAVELARAAALLLRHPPVERSTSARFTAAALLVAVTGLGMRVAGPILWPAEGGIFAVTGWQLASLMLGIVGGIGWTAGFVVLTGERLEGELVAAEREMRRQASTDFLTGALNRRHFMDLASHELVKARRYGLSLAVLLMDLDQFKRVNDEHGHLVGDRVLRALVDTCRTGLREADAVGRYGGEEFVVLLPMTDAGGATAAAERLRSMVAATRVAGCPRPVTVSVGVAALDGDQDLEALLHRADEALYRAKRLGRNRVVRAGDGPSPGRKLEPRLRRPTAR